MFVEINEFELFSQNSVECINNFFCVRSKKLLNSYSMYLFFHYSRTAGVKQKRIRDLNCYLWNHHSSSTLEIALFFLLELPRKSHVSLYLPWETKNFPRIF